MIDQSGSNPSRRERNKSATRQRIAQATLDLVRGHGPGNFTVDDVAAAAGVSRRTFFNYFPSIDAALTVTMDEFLESLLGHFESRPAGENIVESMLQALTRPADPARMAVMAELYGLAEENPEMMRFQLEAWNRCEQRIIASIKHRIGESTDSLYISALVGSVMSCGRCALAQWLRRTGGAITPDSLQQLEDLFVEVIGYLRDGFNR